MVLPGGMITKVKEIHTLAGPVDEAFCPQSVTLILEHDIEVSRGQMIIGTEDLPGAGTELLAKVCWMHPRALLPGRKFLLKHTTHTTQAVVSEITHRIDITTLEPGPAPSVLELNDIGEIRIRTAEQLVYDGYHTNRLTGSFILIEPGTHATVAAGMLLPSKEVVRPDDADFVI